MDSIQTWFAILGSLFGLCGTLVGVVGFIYRRGSSDATSAQAVTELKSDFDDLRAMLKDAAKERHEQFRELESKLDKRIVDVDVRFKEVDQKIAGLQGAINLLRDQRHDDRNFLLENYMKVDDIDKIENRVLLNQKTILEAVAKLEGKLDRVLESAKH